jgi:hypothetical protein
MVVSSSILEHWWKEEYIEFIKFSALIKYSYFLHLVLSSTF